MGKRGNGYGSEDHFLRYRMHRPAQFDGLVLDAVGVSGRLDWVYPKDAPDEREPERLGFLRDRPDVRALWASHWPQSGKGQTWDGVAQLNRADGPVEWLLVEAKANAVEFVTPPSMAKDSGGRPQIEATLNKLKAKLGVQRHYPWLGTYYQFVNRLAVLHFLNEEAMVPARLLNIYFTGDCFPDGRECPVDQAQWQPLLEARRLTLGLPLQHKLSDRIHEAFIPAFA